MELQRQIEAIIMGLVAQDMPSKVIAERIIYLLKEQNKSPQAASEAVSAEFDLLTAEIEALKELCKDLLNGADKCGQEPHYIVQPFLGIVKRHAATINKHDLI